MIQPNPPPRFTPEQARLVAAGARDLLGDAPDPRGPRALEMLREALGVADGELPPCAPEDWGALRGAEIAEGGVVALSVAACLRGGGLTAGAARRVVDYARAAGDKAGLGWARILLYSARGWNNRVTLELARRAPDGDLVLADAWRRGGPLGVVQAAGSAFGWTPSDEERGWWWRRLGLLPEGTLGRRFWEDMTRRGIPLPGERGGLPEAAVHHDLMHTVTGYGTDAAGESQLAAFYSAFFYPNWPAWIFVVLSTFELGMRVGPTFVPPAEGALDPAAMYAAARRARAARFHPLDLDWDYRALMDAPLPEARAALGLAPA